jgi:hypothetical protein
MAGLKILYLTIIWISADVAEEAQTTRLMFKYTGGGTSRPQEV